MVPLAVVDLLIDSPGFGGSRAHIQQQVQVAIKHLNGKEVHLETLRTLGVFGLLLGLAVTEEQEAVGFSGTEVEGDGASLLRVPFVEDDERLRRLKRDGVQRGYVLALEGHSALDLHLGVAQLGQSGQLEPHVVVFVHDLERGRKETESHWVVCEIISA